MISLLPFDSSLFNYPVGKLTIDEDWNEEEFLKEAKEFQLVYIFSEKPIEFKDSQIKWVDTKITFEKNLKNPLENTEIRPYHGELSKELEDLAYLSGTYSRFNTDKRLKNGEFKKLYKIWINKGLESNQILVAPNMAGMVTYTVEKELGRIGLIAVSEKHQNQGLGKKLIQAVEFQTYQMGAKTMQISGQEQNVSSCRLYQSLKYNLVEKVFVYHWWNSFSWQSQ